MTPELSWVEAQLLRLCCPVLCFAVLPRAQVADDWSLDTSDRTASMSTTATTVSLVVAVDAADAHLDSNLPASPALIRVLKATPAEVHNVK